MKKVTKKAIALGLCSVLLTALPVGVHASPSNSLSTYVNASTAQSSVDFGYRDLSTKPTNNEIHQLIPSPPFGNAGVVTPYGTNPPGTDSVMDLSMYSYNYQVQQIGWELYTDKQFTGVSKMTVSIDNWTKIQGDAPSENLQVDLFTSSGSHATGIKVDMASYYGSAYVYFTNLNPSTKYYIRFRIGLTGNKFSFGGEVKKE